MASDLTIRPDRPGRFDPESIGDKILQHVPGRVESVAKIALIAGLAIAQVAKIAGKMLVFVLVGDLNSRFSRYGIARDCIMLTALFQRTFNEGICGVIFAPQSHGTSFVETAAEVFEWVYLDSYHSKEEKETPVRSLITGLIKAQPSFIELVFDKDDSFAKVCNTNEPAHGETRVSQRVFEYDIDGSEEEYTADNETNII